MTKREMIDAVAEKAGLAKVDVEKVYNALFDLLADEIAKGEARVDGFGSFKVAQRAARVAKNPRTGEEIQVPAKKAVTFKPAGALKAKVQ